MPDSNRTANASQMLALIEAYFESGLTQVRFCEEHQITPSKFYYWLKRYQERSGGTEALIPLHVTGKAGPGEVEISYPDGTRLYFNGSVSSVFLKSLLPAFVSK